MHLIWESFRNSWHRFLFKGKREPLCLSSAANGQQFSVLVADTHIRNVSRLLNSEWLVAFQQHTLLPQGFGSGWLKRIRMAAREILSSSRRQESERLLMSERATSGCVRMGGFISFVWCQNAWHWRVFDIRRPGTVLETQLLSQEPSVGDVTKFWKESHYQL